VPVSKRPKWPGNYSYSGRIRNGDIPGDSVRISGCVEILVLESFRSKATHLRIVIRGERLEVGIVRIIDVEFNSYIRRKNEI
jgi:hypothetical protein